MLQGALFEVQVQIFLDQRHVDSGTPGGFDVGA